MLSESSKLASHVHTEARVDSALRNIEEELLQCEQAQQGSNDASKEAVPRPVTQHGHADSCSGAGPLEEANSTLPSFLYFSIKISTSLTSTGIRLDSSGVVISSPGNLLDQTFSVVGINGKRYSKGMETLDGPCAILLRCRKASMLESISRVPARLLQGKTLKLLQVMLTPDDKGFGIDLTDYNGIARVVQGGAASKAEMLPGDVIVGVNGIDTGSRRLVDILPRGKKSYVFLIVRALKRSAEDMVPEDIVNDFPQNATNAKRESDIVEISRVEPNGNTGITVEWNHDEDQFTHYQLQWKLVDDPDWSYTEASSSLKVSIVTKGNLNPSSAYTFRIRGHTTQGAWGPFCTPTAAVRPDGESLGELKSISHAKESDGSILRNGISTDAASASDMQPKRVGSVASSQGSQHQTAKSFVASDHDVTNFTPKRAASAVEIMPERAQTAVRSKDPTHPVARVPSVSGLSWETVEGVLADQRQAIEAEQEQKITEIESDFLAQLRAAQASADEWKQKYLDVNGSQMRVLMNARKDARDELLQEIASDEAAIAEAKMMKEKALQAIEEANERVRIAEAKIEEQHQEAEKYKSRMMDAKQEAKEQAEKAEAEKIQFVLKNAALELRDQMKKIEAQHAHLTQRKIAEAVKTVETKGAAQLRITLHNLEIAHASKLQALRTIAGAEAEKQISSAREGHEARLAESVQEALTNARRAAIMKEAAEVEAARLEATRETEEQIWAEMHSLKQQLKRAEEQNQMKVVENAAMKDRVRQQLEQIRLASAEELSAAVAAVRKEEEDKAELERQKMVQAMAAKVEDAVAKREYELINQYRKEMQQKALMEKKADTLVEALDDVIGQDFEEQIMKITQPVSCTEAIRATSRHRRDVGAPTQMPHVDDFLEEDNDSVVASDFSLAHPKAEMPLTVVTLSRVLDDEDEHAQILNNINSLQACLSTAEARLRERHIAETRALVTRHQLEKQFGTRHPTNDLSHQHDAEMEDLRQQQLEEAIAMGAALAYQEDLRKGPASPYLQLTYQPLEDDATVVSDTFAREFPSLHDALNRVQHMKKQLEKLSKPNEELEQLLRVEKREHEQTTRKLLQLTQKEDREGADSMSETEQMSLRASLKLLQLQGKSSVVMQELLNEVSLEATSNEMEEAAEELKKALVRDEAERRECAAALDDLLEKGVLDRSDMAELSHLLKVIRGQQDQANVRKAQLKWLHAESRRQRIMRLHEARAEFEELQQSVATASNTNLEIPCPPIAAAHDETSIAVDWLPPNAKTVSVYHIQWREVGSNEWLNSEGSKKLLVPCCLKGELRAYQPYEFRVRAGDHDGQWGPWSRSSDAVATRLTMHTTPSRPKVVALTRARIEVQWDCTVRDVVKYEVEWRTAEASWDDGTTEYDESERKKFITPSLHPGSIYVFRVRASHAAYSGYNWTPFSEVSVPIRPLAMERVKHKVEVESMPLAGLQRGGDPRGVVSFPRSVSADEPQSMDIVPIRRRGDDCTSVVSSSTFGPSPTEVEAEAAMQTAAAAAAATLASIGDSMASDKIMARLQSIDELHEADKEKLAELRQHHERLQSQSRALEVERIIDEQHRSGAFSEGTSKKSSSTPGGVRIDTLD